jgi:putative Mg2+ transporter-C (MgtC) family protein
MNALIEQEIIPLVIRLVSAAAMGAAIGYEREFRGKGAGVRTHMLVAMGACLFMMISKYAFGDIGQFETAKYDAARVAAGVVSGIGFLGGGLIIKSKTNLITGLTTAAGLWVTAAIGLGAGSGMVLMAAICTVLVIICTEILNACHFKLGYHQMTTVLTSEDEKALEEAIRKLGNPVKYLSFARQGDRYKAEISMRVPKREKPLDLITRLTSIPGVQLESLE